MREATQNLLKDAEKLIGQFERLDRLDTIGNNITPEWADDFGYDASMYEADDARDIHNAIWDNEASALEENNAGSYDGIQLVHLGSIEAVLKAVDPETYDALQAIEDFIASGAILI